MRERDMARFWDERAGEDPFYFVDTRLEYGRPDVERFWAGGQEDLDRMLGMLGVAIAPGDDLVDVGCGVGRLTRVMARRARSVRALDVSPRMIELAREQNRELANVEWIVGDGTTLSSVETSSADGCVSHVVFQHIPDPEVTLGYVREMGRVLRPGGWAAFQVSNYPAYHRRPGPFERVLSAMGRGPRGRERPEWRGSHVEIDAVRAAARDGGMDVERVLQERTPFCVILARAR